MRYLILVVICLSVNLALAFHPNDECSTALPLTTIPASGLMNTAGAASDVTPVCSPAVPVNGVWFTVVGNGTTLQFSTCDMDGEGAHALQVYEGTCGGLVCVGGNDATFCHINTSTADVRWCAEAGVTYYIHLGAESSGSIIAYYALHSLGACNYIGGNCVPEVVFAPAEFGSTARNRDDCCFMDAADQHFLVYLPYASDWKFLACGGSQPHQYLGTDFCGNNICEQSDNLGEEEPGCFYGSRCGCMLLGPGYVHVTVETSFDDGIGQDFQYKIRDCNLNNILPPIDLDPEDVSSSCELVFGGGYRLLRVFSPTLDPARPPVVSVAIGCESCEQNIAPAASAAYDPNGWVLHPPSPNITGQELPYWQNVIQGQGQGYVCVRLEGFLPVNLLDFTAIAGNDEITLRWTTAAEQDLHSFAIERDGTALHEAAATNSATGSTYTYADRDVQDGVRYTYTLFATNLLGERELLATTDATPGSNSGVIGGFALAQNYPNPFNPETTIEYSINESGPVTLNVFDLNGREVMQLVNGSQSAGAHSVKVDASSLSSGIYFYQLEHNGLKLARKMALLK
ncbi:MAG: T9SS type A sorting domain-containing protein [bacterium]|nr:T9SS type A sorting domain-containing protein [bacterium]